MKKRVNQVFLDKPPLEKVIEEFLPLINHWANKYAFYGSPTITKEDLVSAGIIGLIEAYNRYDPGRGVKFKTFAEIRIKGAILDEIRKVDIIPRSTREKIEELENKVKELNQKLGRMPEETEIAEYMNLSLEEYHKFLDSIKGITFIDIQALKQRLPEIEEDDIFEFIGDTKEDPFEKVYLKELVEKLEKALDCLTEKERLVLALYYYEDLTMKEIAKVLNLSEGRVSQIHTQALIKLRALLKD